MRCGDAAVAGLRAANRMDDRAYCCNAWQVGRQEHAMLLNHFSAA